MRSAVIERIGEYEVVGRLGQGAMGVVLRVRHARLGVERALKVLSSTTPDRLQRFEREVRALAEVRHPNVVGVHEAGQHGGRPWLVMDLVEGEPLDQVLRRGRLPLEGALRLAGGLARGLVALHARGVIHRDLKPGNVMVRPGGEGVILDLGLAVAPESDERLTRTGALVGTLGYMAPEQLLGQRAAPACDVYALGAILFEAASGEPLVEGSPTLQSMIAAVVEGRTRSLSSVGTDLPEALDRLVARLLAREPSERPTAAEAVEALEDAALRGGRSVREARRRSRLRAAAIGLCVLGALGGGVIAALDALQVASPAPASAAAVATSAQPAPNPNVDPVAVTRALERAMNLPAAHDRAVELAVWLRAHPTNARADEALSAWRAARRQAPLTTWQASPGAERTHVRFVDDRRVVVWLNSKKGLRLADLWTGEVVRSLGDLDVEAEARDPRGGLLLAVDFKRLRRLAPGADKPIKDLPLPVRARVQGLAATREHVVVLQDDVARVLDRADGRVLREIGPIGDSPKSLALIDGDRVLIVASGPNVYDQDANAMPKVRGFDVTTGALLFENHAGDRMSLLVPGPGATFAGGTAAGTLASFDAAGERRRQFAAQDVERHFVGDLLQGVAHETTVRDGVFADEGRRLVTISGHFSQARGDLRCWDTTTGAEVAPSVRWSWGGCTVDLSRDERVLVVGLASGFVEVWAAPHREPDLDLEPRPPGP